MSFYRHASYIKTACEFSYFFFVILGKYYDGNLKQDTGGKSYILSNLSLKSTLTFDNMHLRKCRLIKNNGEKACNRLYI